MGIGRQMGIPCLAKMNCFGNDSSEPEGIGRGPEDTFQEEMAEKLATAGGGMVNGRCGAGKSHLIKLLKPKLENIGY